MLIHLIGGGVGLLVGVVLVPVFSRIKYHTERKRVLEQFDDLVRRLRDEHRQ